MTERSNLIKVDFKKEGFPALSDRIGIQLTASRYAAYEVIAEKLGSRELQTAPAKLFMASLLARVKAIELPTPTNSAKGRLAGKGIDAAPTAWEIAQESKGVPLASTNPKPDRNLSEGEGLEVDSPQEIELVA